MKTLTDQLNDWYRAKLLTFREVRDQLQFKETMKMAKPLQSTTVGQYIQTVPPQPIAPITGEMSSLMDKLAEASASLADLSGRLSPCLFPDVSMDGVPNEEPAAASELYTKLHEATLRVDLLTRGIRNLLHRLEV